MRRERAAARSVARFRARTWPGGVRVGGLYLEHAEEQRAAAAGSRREGSATAGAHLATTSAVSVLSMTCAARRQRTASAARGRM